MTHYAHINPKNPINYHKFSDIPGGAMFYTVNDSLCMKLNTPSGEYNSVNVVEGGVLISISPERQVNLVTRVEFETKHDHKQFKQSQGR